MGDFLFKYRGQIPVLLFFLVIPFICKTDYSSFSNKTIVTNNIISITISFSPSLHCILCQQCVDDTSHLGVKQASHQQIPYHFYQ